MITQVPTARHPLSVRHIRQIVRRPPALKQRMPSIWAMTWRPGVYQSNFLGNLFRPLGSATMMVQASYQRRRDQEGISLAGVAARLDSADLSVHYQDMRLRHEFHFTPEVGARGKVLDPGDDRLNRRGNRSWVKLALDVDLARQRSAREQRPLPSVPKLPQIFFGYGSREQVKHVQEAHLHSLAAAHCWKDDVGSVCQCQQRLAGQLVSADVLQSALRFAWEAELVPPSDPHNNTGLWLLPHPLAHDLQGVIRVFEYFGDLVGCEIPNPARRLNASCVPNPAVEIAWERGVHLVADLALLTETSAGSPEYLAIEEKIVALLPAYRSRLRASEELSDQDLLHALCAYETPVVLATPFSRLSEDEQLAMMRSELAAEQNECCSDDDLLKAIRSPNQPLLLSGLCQVQLLRRDPELPLAESLRFSPEELGRERVDATLWQSRGEFDRGFNEKK